MKVTTFSQVPTLFNSNIDLDRYPLPHRKKTMKKQAGSNKCPLRGCPPHTVFSKYLALISPPPNLALNHSLFQLQKPACKNGTNKGAYHTNYSHNTLVPPHEGAESRSPKNTWHHRTGEEQGWPTALISTGASPSACPASG